MLTFLFLIRIHMPLTGEQVDVCGATVCRHPSIATQFSMACRCELHSRSPSHNQLISHRLRSTSEKRMTLPHPTPNPILSTPAAVAGRIQHYHCMTHLVPIATAAQCVRRGPTMSAWCHSTATPTQYPLVLFSVLEWVPM